MSVIPKEVDFVVLKEDYSRILVIEDGTIIKAKIVVKKILFDPQMTPQGYPIQVGLDSVNAVTAFVPESAKRQPSKESLDIQRDKGKEVKFEEQKVETQEYMTPNGFRITVKPVVTKIIKYDKFNIYGEPIYNVNVQAITNIEKIESTE